MFHVDLIHQHSWWEDLYLVISWKSTVKIPYCSYISFSTHRCQVVIFDLCVHIHQKRNHALGTHFVYDPTKLVVLFGIQIYLNIVYPLGLTSINIYIHICFSWCLRNRWCVCWFLHTRKQIIHAAEHDYSPTMNSHKLHNE